MFDFLINDPRLYAPMATCLGIIVSVILWIKNQRRKELSYQVITNKPLVGLKGSKKKKVEIFYDGVNVNDAHLLVLKLINSGHLPINPSDFEGKVSVKLSAGTRILLAQVEETAPSDLVERYREKSGKDDLIEIVDDSKVILNPVLLNGNDFITVQLLLNYPVRRVRLIGHVQGIGQIQELRPRSIASNMLIFLGFLVLVPAMIYVDPRSFMPLQLEELLPFILAGLLGFVLLCAGFFLHRRAKDLLLEDM